MLNEEWKAEIDELKRRIEDSKNSVPRPNDPYGEQLAPLYSSIAALNASKLNDKLQEIAKLHPELKEYIDAT